MYYTYMIRCIDNSIYTGITNNIEERFNKHISGTGAKYTKSHKAEKIEAVWRSKDKSLVCKLEYQIKQLDKSQKEDQEGSLQDKSQGQSSRGRKLQTRIKDSDG